MQLCGTLLLLSACSLSGISPEGADSKGETFWVDANGIVTRVKKNEIPATEEEDPATEVVSSVKNNPPTEEVNRVGSRSPRLEEDFSEYVDSDQLLSNHESKGFYTWVDSLGVPHTSAVSVGPDQQEQAPLNNKSVNPEPKPYISSETASPLVLPAPLIASTVPAGLNPLSFFPLKQVNDRYLVKFQSFTGVLSVLCINKLDDTFKDCLDVVIYREAVDAQAGSAVYMPVQPVIAANRATWKSYAKMRFSITAEGGDSNLLVSFPLEAVSSSSVNWLLGNDAK